MADEIRLLAMIGGGVVCGFAVLVMMLKGLKEMRKSEAALDRGADDEA